MSESFRPTILWVRLNMTFQLIYHEIQKTLKKESLTLPQLDILVCLGRAKGLTLGEIGERLMVTGGNITGVMDRWKKADSFIGPGHGGPENYSSESSPPRGFYFIRIFSPSSKKNGRNCGYS